MTSLLFVTGVLSFMSGQFILSALLFGTASLTSNLDLAVLFALDEHDNQIAMLLIEKNGNFYCNTEAKSKLKEYWKSNYDSNVRQLIPFMAKQLKSGEIAVTGLTVQSRLEA